MRTHPELSRTGVRLSPSESMLGLRPFEPYLSSADCDFTEDEEVDGAGEGMLDDDDAVFDDGGGTALERPVTLPIRSLGTLV